MKPLLIILPLLLIFSCGKESGGGSSLATAEPQREEPVSDGKYRAILRPLNTSVNGFIPSGNAEFVIDGDRMNVTTYLDDDAAVTHIQNIHAGRECPTLGDDLNGDGLIDFPETMRKVHGVLLPLDGDLNSQLEGQGIYPRGSSFTYQKNASLIEILKDLTSKDDRPEDHLIKLSPGSTLSLEGKVVLIHGTADRETVPSTVESALGLPRHQTIPIACGKIERISN